MKQITKPNIMQISDDPVIFELFVTKFIFQIYYLVIESFGVSFLVKYC